MQNTCKQNMQNVHFSTVQNFEQMTWRNIIHESVEAKAIKNTVKTHHNQTILQRYWQVLQKLGPLKPKKTKNELKHKHSLTQASA